MSFSSGFSSGFASSAPVAPVPSGGGGTGVGVWLGDPVRRRSVDLEGLGLIHIVGTAELLVLRGFGEILLRGIGALEAEMSDEAEALALLGIPPNSEEGIALWLLLS